MLQQDWSQALTIEHEMYKCFAKQKRHGFLIDKDLTEEYIGELSDLIEDIDAEAIPQMPLALIPVETKKAGVYSHVKKPFNKNGKLAAKIQEYVDSAFGRDLGGDDCDGVIGGPFTRVRFDQFDLGSAAKVKDYLLAQGWVPDEWNFSKLTGERTSPKMSQEEEFLGVTGNVGNLVAKRIVFRHRRSQLTGFMNNLRPDGRLTADISGIAATGRYKHKVIVNVPGGDAIYGHKMREVFIVPDNYVLIGCDAASCQLRMLCHYMGDAEYTHAVINGKSEDGTDIHSVNQRIAGCATRAQAKTLIYAILFGAGDAKLAAQLGVSKKEAKQMRARFLDNLPKLKTLVSNLKKAWKKKGYLTGLDGRKIFVRSEHMLLVYLLQSAEAVMMKIATLYAHKWSKKYDAHMVAHVHDEFQWEVLAKDSEKVAELLARAIVKAGTYLELTVPMAGDSNIGINWKETH